MSVIFPKWTNVLPTVLAVGVVGGLTSIVAGACRWQAMVVGPERCGDEASGRVRYAIAPSEPSR